MLKVFLVEDESVVREGLRDNIPWQQYGYRFVGEAGDGEMALPLIRKTQPDVLITDIKMPFMDGLSLCHIVGQEFPNMKMIIISGYDDFEYARQAIKEGVEQYLSKPITRSAMQKVLAEVKEKIEGEQEQKNYLKKYQNEMREYEHFFRRDFFEKVFDGKISVQEMYEEAQKLSLDISAPCYNLVLVSAQEKKGMTERGECAEEEQRMEEELMRYFLRFSEYIVFRWNINTYGIVIKGEESNVEEYTTRCINQIEQIFAKASEHLEWYYAVGTPVDRFSRLEECYNHLNHVFSYRFMFQDKHYLTDQLVEEYLPQQDDGRLEKLDISKVDPDIIKGFLINGQKDEISEFVSSYIESLKDVLESKLFRDYLLLSIRFTTVSYVESLGGKQQEFLTELEREGIGEFVGNKDSVRKYVESLMESAIDFRDKKNICQGKEVIKKALEYIDENYTDEALSLNVVAEINDVSANYFSAMFSQRMEMTFIEYVTKKRMEKAKELLRTTKMRSAEIAPAIGYKDPHYFSFVFKKTQGCTPKEYRYGKR